MRLSRITVVLLLASCIAIPALAEETSPPAHVDHFRVGAGLGIHYGGYGLNTEYLVNRYSSMSAALGFFPHAGPGWAVGATLYPLKNDRAVNPRLSGYFGRMSTLKRINIFTGQIDYEAINGGTLGGGVEWRLYKQTSVDFDLFYVIEDLPAGVAKKDYVGGSFGIGVKF